MLIFVCNLNKVKQKKKVTVKFQYCQVCFLRTKMELDKELQYKDVKGLISLNVSYCLK